LDFRERWIILGTFGAAITSRCFGPSGSSMLLSYPISDSTSTTQLSLLSFELSKSLFKLSLSSVSEMLSGAPSSSLWIGWRLIPQIWRTFKIWVHPPGRFFADTGGGKGNPSVNLNAASPSCWKSDHDAVTISSVSEMYPTAANCLFRVRDSFCIARRF
jgi:hypothetical protein